MDNKNNYNTPEVSFINLSDDDVITSSSSIDDQNNPHGHGKGHNPHDN